MAHSPKCRAKGGPGNCTDPNCPEKQAIITDFMAARAARQARDSGHPVGANVTPLRAPTAPVSAASVNRRLRAPLSMPQPNQEIRITVQEEFNGRITYTDYNGTIKHVSGNQITLNEINIVHRDADGKPYFAERRHAKVNMQLNLAEAHAWEITDTSTAPIYDGYHDDYDSDEEE